MVATRLRPDRFGSFSLTAIDAVPLRESSDRFKRHARPRRNRVVRHISGVVRLNLRGSLRCSTQSSGRSSAVRRVALSSTGCRPCRIVSTRSGLKKARPTSRLDELRLRPQFGHDDPGVHDQLGRAVQSTPRDRRESRRVSSPEPRILCGDGLTGGGGWIRTLGPPATASFVVGPPGSLLRRAGGGAVGTAVQPDFSCSASHSIEPGWGTV